MLSCLSIRRLRSGPLAPVAVTVATVESRPIAPSLFGIGTVQARYYTWGSATVPGRVKRLDGPAGRAGQGQGGGAGRDGSGGGPGPASGPGGQSRAPTPLCASCWCARRPRLRRPRPPVRATAGRAWRQQRRWAIIKRQDLAVAQCCAGGRSRGRGNRCAPNCRPLHAQRGNLRLVTPVDGLVASRDADPGTHRGGWTGCGGGTIDQPVGGHALRPDRAQGLAAGLPAQVIAALAPGHTRPWPPACCASEPRADAVTEETLVKVVFDSRSRRCCHRWGTGGNHGAPARAAGRAHHSRTRRCAPWAAS